MKPQQKFGTELTLQTVLSILDKGLKAQGVSADTSFIETEIRKFGEHCVNEGWSLGSRAVG